MSAEQAGEPASSRRYFDEQAGYWRDVYDQPDLQGLVYRRRMETTLSWIDQLGLKPGAPALDVGCGAGLLSVELARRGLNVTATDSSPRMVDLAREHAAQEGVHVRALEAHVDRLPFEDAEVSLVVALGLLPWLADPGLAIAEMARVLAPGGWLIVTADNRARLNWLVEPRENPILMPLKLAYRAHKRRRGVQPAGAASYLHLPAAVDRMLKAVGMVPSRRTSIGFGPFTFMGRRLMPEALGAALHRRLERACRRSRLLRRTGWHYIVAAQKRSG